MSDPFETDEDTDIEGLGEGPDEGSDARSGDDAVESPTAQTPRPDLSPTPDETAEVDARPPAFTGKPDEPPTRRSHTGPFGLRAGEAPPPPAQGLIRGAAPADRPSQGRPSQGRPSQSRPSQSRPPRNRPSHNRPSQSRAPSDRPSQSSAPSVRPSRSHLPGGQGDGRLGRRAAGLGRNPGSLNVKGNAVRTRSGSMELGPARRRAGRAAPSANAAPATPDPTLGQRIGIQDRRLGEPGERLQPLDNHTISLRVADIDVMEADVKPADEPLGRGPAPSGGASKMVVFFGSKGGVGSTTVACNVGGLLARANHPTVLVDMDLQLGAVPVSLNVRPERSLAELIDEAEATKTGPLRTALDRHETGLRVAAQTRIEELGAVTTKRLPRLFDALTRGYRYVLVDGLRDFNDHAVAVMDMAHLVVLVITQDVPSVRAAARCLRLFRRLGYKSDRLMLVVNRFHKRAPVDLEAIHRALGMPPGATVHNDFPIIEQALNRGKLVEDISRRSRPARDLDTLARVIAGEAEGDPRRGLISRLLGR